MIQIVTDSTCDLGERRGEELGVRILPLTVRFGEESFLDGVDLTAEEFYARLERSDTLPRTSQLNPELLQEVFQELVERGDEVVGIFISSELSGTFQSARIAREMADRPERIHLVDSRSVTIPMRLLVEEAVKLRDRGASSAGIAEEVRGLTGRVRMLAALDTLRYLKLGGRISGAAAVAGELLGITPLVGVLDGKVVSIGKCRGRKAALKWMEEHLKEEPIDFSRCIGFGHSACPEAMEQVMEHFSAEIAQASQVITGSLGATVGTYAGPGATGIVYFTK